jgi:PAS domain S-box-containing protein
VIIIFTALYSITSSATSKKTLKVGIYENEPKIFTNKGVPSGFWVELLDDIAAKEAWNIQWVHGTWEECIFRLKEGHIDLMPDVAYTKERSKLYSFQKETVFTSWARVYVSRNSKIQSFTDLDNKKIAVLKGSVNYVDKDGIKELTEKFGINCSFVETHNYDSVFKLIETGKADAGVTNKNFGNKKESEYKVKRTAMLFQPSDLRFAFSKKTSSNAFLISQIDYRIKQLKKDENSTYYYLIEKYFEGHIKEKIVIPAWVKIVMYSITVILFFLLAVSVVSRHQIKRTTAKLKESEERYRTLFENSPEGILVAEIKNMQFLYANPAICKMLGYSKEELKQIKLSDIHPQDSIKYISSEFEIQAKEGKDLPLSIPCLRKDGTIIYTNIVTSKMDIQGRECNVGFFTDITQRKKVEEEKEKINLQLLQAQKMESVGRLAGTIAHDFNNLLTAIIGYGHLLYDEIEKEDPRSKMLEEILNAAKRAAGLTSQLLAFSRKNPIKLEVLDFNSIITEFVDMIDRLIGENIVFTSNLEKGQMNTKGDATQIEQIILNLVVNARDAMPEGGKLEVKTEKITISDEEAGNSPYARKGDFICLSVSDTGKGIDKEIVSKIFEPFYTTKKTGTGLGLSVVKEIIKKQDGWINVESEVGKGTTFKIYLPVCNEKKTITSKGLIDLADLQGRGETVLVIEDEKITRRFITKVLKENGYKVLQAASIEDASGYMNNKEKEIQMLFSDVVLSDGSGLQFAEEHIKKNQNLKVILSSGYTNEKAELSSIAKKKFQFLEKPYEVQDLLTKVKETFS